MPLCVSVQYAMHLYGFLKELRKNPHCSFSCCLGLLLPLNDLQGEVRGLVGKNVLRSQLQTGDFELVTFRAAVKDSGALDVTFEEAEQGDDHAVDPRDDDRPVAKICKTKCHQGTQTEFLKILAVADIPVNDHEQIEDTHL